MGISNKKDIYSKENMLPFKESLDRFFYEYNISHVIDGNEHSWAPVVDIYETQSNIVVKAELPGLIEDDIKIEINERSLILKGERKLRKGLKEDNFYRIERYYGSFLRQFKLPGTVDKKNVQANYKDGVLTVLILKEEEKHKKVIKINTNINT